MRSKVELHCVDPAKAMQVWPHVEALFQAAVERCGDWTLEDVKAGISQGGMLLWITWDGMAIKAAAVTRVMRAPRGLVCHAVACGGQDDDWAKRFSEIEDYARREGCIEARIDGRPGWQRMFRDYRVECVTLTKRL